MSKKKLPFYPGLEGLRGVSVAAVLVFHAWPSVLPGGFLGVSTFFTLSGFLITGLLFEEWRSTGSIALGAFWGRRLRRLLPASLLGLAVIAVGAVFLGSSTQQERVTGDALSALFYFVNWWLIGTGAAYDSLMGSPSPVQHFWSLSIEEQYYLVYPILTALVLFLSKGSRGVYGIFLFSAAIASWCWMIVLGSADVTTARVYYGTDTRCAELLAGGLLALLLAGRPAMSSAALQVAGVLAFTVSAFAWRVAEVETAALYSWGLPAYTLSTVVLIAAALQSQGPVGAVLSSAPLRWMGRISYGLYVYHWPVLLWLTPERTGLPGVPAALFAIGLSLALAALSHRYIETPIRSGEWFRRSDSTSSSSPVLFPGWAVGLGAILSVALILVGTANRGPLTLAEQLTSSWSVRSESMAAAPTGGLRIAVAGDSVGRDIGQGLAMWARGTKAALVKNVAARGCGIARGAWSEGGRAKRVCDAWPARARKTFERFPPQVVVVVTSGWDLMPRQLPDWGKPRRIGDPKFDRWLVDQYRQALDVFYETGATVVWLTSPCVRQRNARVERHDLLSRRHLNEIILPQVLEEHGRGRMTIVDLFGEVCPGGRFAPSLHGIDRFRHEDGYHFSRAGKQWLGSWLGERLLELRRGTAGVDSRD